MMRPFARRRPPPRHLADPLDDTIAEAVSRLGETPTQPNLKILDLPRVERQIVAARWRQAGDPRLAELEQLIAVEDRIFEELRRLKDEEQCLEFVRNGTIPIRLPLRLTEEVAARQASNERRLREVRRSIGDLIEQA